MSRCREEPVLGFQISGFCSKLLGHLRTNKQDLPRLILDLRVSCPDIYAEFGRGLPDHLKKRSLARVRGTPR